MHCLEHEEHGQVDDHLESDGGCTLILDSVQN